MTILSDSLQLAPDDLDSYWMPFTANRQFKASPRLFVKAEGMYYWTADGRKVLDGFAGLWCCNAGHCRKPITEAIQKQAAVMDYAPAFQMGHPLAFELANRIVDLAPGQLDHVFFCNSGSEAVDTALKMALGYQRLRGEGSRIRFIGRERGYHGVGFGGISVGGIVANRKMFGTMLTGVDHLPHTLNIEKNAYTKGQPEWGAHLADEMEKLVALHDASTIAAVIVEPIAGSTGVHPSAEGLPAAPSRDHEEARNPADLRRGHHRVRPCGCELCVGRLRRGARHDHVRQGRDFRHGADGWRDRLEDIYQAYMTGPPAAIEIFHGYTYSAHPLACAAGVATLQLYKDEDLFARAAKMAPKFEAALHSLKGTKHVIDIRNQGLVGGVELSPRAGAPGARGFETYLKCYEKNVLIRSTGDIMAIAPALIIEEKQIDEIVQTLRDVLNAVD